MKKTNTYLAVTVTKNGKQSSFVLPVSGSLNLVSTLKGIPGLSAANICATKKDAEQITCSWNDCARRNGNYMY